MIATVADQPSRFLFGTLSDPEDPAILGDAFGTIEGTVTEPLELLSSRKKVISRGEALRRILSRLGISTLNNGINHLRFGVPISQPIDIYEHRDLDYIVTALNKGITTGKTYYRPTESVSKGEFLEMIVKAIPIPLNNPYYEQFDYYTLHPSAKYFKAAFNAGIIKNELTDFYQGVTESEAIELLQKAYSYYLGEQSGISVYARWEDTYADIDLYLYNPSATITQIKLEGTNTISNMEELRGTGGLAYYGNHSTGWGASLDYDSFGGNGQQPWAGVGEERITVDSLQVKRPGSYHIVLCYSFAWNPTNSDALPLPPSKASVEWWAINGGKNINWTGRTFETTVNRGNCILAGTLMTNP